MPIDPAVLDLPFEEYLECVADFTDDVLIPAEPSMVEQGKVPGDVMDHIARIGLFGITIPRALGGFGWSIEQQVRLTMEFTRASAVYRSRFSPVIGLCSQAMLDHGSAEQVRRMLPRMATGELVTSFALTEEAAGSDASAVQTTARRDGDGYRITGTKRYITNAAWADLFLVFAQHVEGGVDGMSTFLVPADLPGVRAVAATRMNGHEAGPVASIVLDDVKVPADALLGKPGAGLKVALRGINHARTHVAATCVGQGMRLLDEMARHALSRRQFGAPLADLGAVEGMLGTSYADLAAGRALVLECARRFDQGPIPHHEIGAAKYFTSEAVGRIADRAVQVLGGEGIVGDSPVPRMWRDVRALRIYEGSSEVHERNMARMVKDVVRRREPLWTW